MLVDGTVICLVGAEGRSELESETYLRDASDAEKNLFFEFVANDWESDFRTTIKDPRELQTDGMGRPYFLTVVDPAAPTEILERAKESVRRVRLTE